MHKDNGLRGELDRAIAFQKKWRRVTSFSYFAGASPVWSLVARGPQLAARLADGLRIARDSRH